MYTISPTIISFFFALVSAGCLSDSGTDTVVDDYDVTWIDLQENRSLYKHKKVVSNLYKDEELVPAYVFAVGYNSRFIFAKQYPLFPNLKEKIDTSVTNYYIIERTRNQVQDKPIYGPLAKSGFDSLCLRFKIVKPQFTLIYPTTLY